MEIITACSKLEAEDDPDQNGGGEEQPEEAEQKRAETSHVEIQTGNISGVTGKVYISGRDIVATPPRRRLTNRIRILSVRNSRKLSPTRELRNLLPQGVFLFALYNVISMGQAHVAENSCYNDLDKFCNGSTDNRYRMQTRYFGHHLEFLG